MWIQQHKTQKRIPNLQISVSVSYFGESLEKKSWKIVCRQCQTKTTQIWSHVPTIVCLDDQLFCRYKVYRQNILLSFTCENTSQAETKHSVTETQPIEVSLTLESDFQKLWSELLWAICWVYKSCYNQVTLKCRNIWELVHFCWLQLVCS